MLFNEEAVWRIFFVGDVSSNALLVTVVAIAAVFGPLIGGLVATRRDSAVSMGDLFARIRRVNVGGSNYLIALGFLAIAVAPPLVINVFTADRRLDGPTIGQLVPFLAVFFVYQMLTSATEEVGWRGYLVEKMLPGRSFWDTGWTIGFVWAAWHYPVVVMIFAEQGMEPPAIVGSLAGFTMGIVAMSIFHTWFYERTRSVFFSMLLHAVFNTVPLTIVLLFKGSPTALLSNLVLWAVVFYLRKREGLASEEAV
jgi:membrane protease YdiL (CAAX protease family)